MNDPNDQFEHPMMPDDLKIPYLPDVGEEFTIIKNPDEYEALKALTATVAMFGSDPIEIPNLDLDGRLHDAPDNDRGAKEDAIFEASLVGTI